MGNTETRVETIREAGETRIERVVQKVIEYRIPPQILEKLNVLEEEKKDPKKAIAKQNEMKALICQSLQSQQFPTNFPQKRVVFLGRTSCGKSSLINKLFGTKLQTRAGRCTSVISKAYQTKGVVVYDVPGFDNKFNLTKDYDLMVGQLGQINAAYVLFNSSVTDVQDLIKILLAMKRQVFLVRTQCDNIDENQIPLEEQLENDKKELQQLGVTNPQVFACSKKGAFDNQKLLLQILN